MGKASGGRCHVIGTWREVEAVDAVCVFCVGSGAVGLEALFEDPGRLGPGLGFGCCCCRAWLGGFAVQDFYDAAFRVVRQWGHQ